MNDATKQALQTLKAQLEAAPKSKAGFVNWAGAKKFRTAARAAIVASGVDVVEADVMIMKVSAPFDTTYSKSSNYM